MKVMKLLKEPRLNAGHSAYAFFTVLAHGIARPFMVESLAAIDNQIMCLRCQTES